MSLELERLAKEGEKAYKRGDFLIAAHLYQTTSQSMLNAGDELSAAEMLNNASVAYLQAGEFLEAFKSTQGTEVTFSQVGDLRREAIALGNLGAALDGLKRFEEAIQAYERCSQLLKEIEETELRAAVMQSLSALQLRTGQQLEALATMKAGLEGIQHPSVKQRLLKKLIQTPFKLISRS